MGCSSSSESQSANKLLTAKKPAIFFIGGGPASNKGIISEYIVRDYKFKYLSSYDMIQFEQERGGPDAQQIQRAFNDNKSLDSNSQLIVRIVKKAIASCGIRRFIIDGFPSKVEEIQEFNRELMKNKEIDFGGYININVSKDRMKECGIKAHQNSDKNADKQAIQKKVVETIDLYLKQHQKIKQYYTKMGKYIQIDGNSGPDEAYSKIRNHFNLNNINPPRPVKVFFSHFDDPYHENLLCDDLVRKYGLYYYTPAGLINQAKFKGHSSEGVLINKLQKENKEVPPQIVLSLIRKKIEKHDFEGNFLFSGYPRRISDAQLWDRQFGWETQVCGYLTFEIPDAKFKKLFSERQVRISPSIKSEKITQKFDQYQKNQSEICNYYKNKNLLLTIDANNTDKALQDIHNFFEKKNFHARAKISNKSLYMMTTICGPFVPFNKSVITISFESLLEKQVKSNGLYSELIDSYVKINKPIPGLIATKIVLSQVLKQSLNAKEEGIIIDGFPNSAEHLQSWEEEVGEAIPLKAIIYYEYDQKYIESAVKQNIKDKKYPLYQKIHRIISGEKDAVNMIKRYGQQLENKIQCSDWKHYKILQKQKANAAQKIKEFISKV